MKNIFLLLMTLLSTLSFGQSVKKTSFMVMPHDKFMVQNGYAKAMEMEGEEFYQFNYKKALLEDPDLLPVIGKIEGILNERGLKVVNMESKLGSISLDSAEKMALQSKSSGSSVAENAFDKLMKTAKADVLVKVDYRVVQSGPKKSVSIMIQGVDSFTNQPVATITDPGSTASFESSVPVLLEEAVLKKIDTFLDQIETHAQDTFDNGRKVKLFVERWDNWPYDFESEYQGKELREVIEDWMRVHTVKGNFEMESGENSVVFDARIPVFDASGNAITATHFIRDLSRFLRATPFGIENKLIDKYGLGKSKIILGEK